MRTDIWRNWGRTVAVRPARVERPGTVDEVVASLAADETLHAATDVSFQVHSIAATHELTLRSLQLLADEVAPRLGFATGPDAAEALRRAHRPLAGAHAGSATPSGENA